jgi:transglutaminase-like putative cysteine protease
MFIRIHHTLSYTYDRPVFLEPATVRLTPRQDPTQRLCEHDLLISPEPAGATWSIEQDGSGARVCWFSDKHKTLSIGATSIVETLRDNPFDALVTHAPAARLPVEYPTHAARALAPTLGGTVDPTVGDWADSIAEACGHDTLAFLSKLTDRIFDDCRMVTRDEGDPMTPGQTLTEQRGACRDVAILFIAACRSQGLAARFVSGYSIHGPPEITEQELHAWAEVYLPGAGWRGYDPSLGLATSDGHIPLASAPSYELAAPTTGSYRGTGATSTMQYSIAIDSSDTRQTLNTHPVPSST